ncbi:uncharacterized protein METZ01_LOCUS194961 [marine metagenome]|uniref:Uncharacterized protein n=1 Tax=marine metagenome TaxID=408172 RepID=A0A382DX06_9ZZZZ
MTIYWMKEVGPIHLNWIRWQDLAVGNTLL